MTDELLVEIHQQNAQMLELLNSIVFGQAALAARVDRILIDRQSLDPVLSVLGHGRGIPFLAAAAVAKSEALRVEAASKGDRLPDLPRELDRAGITDAAGLGKYLGARKGQGVEEVGRVGEGMLWQLM